MRKAGVIFLSSGAVVALGLALIAAYSSCGSTSGGVNSRAAFGQFVSQSCSPESPNGGGNCLTLSVPNAVPADGTTVSGFRAQLVDGSGIPIPGVQVCFAFEDPGVATILEPTDACGLTGANGLISGQFRDGTQTGSFQLVATAPAGFGLQTRRTISFTPAGTPVQAGTVNSPCASDSDCNPNLFCTFNDACFSGASTCQPKNANGGCCRADEECLSGTCDPTTQLCATNPCTASGGGCAVDSDCCSGTCLFGECA